ncbi:MAG: hypothetical protein ABII79_04225 [bacterium]
MKAKTISLWCEALAITNLVLSGVAAIVIPFIITSTETVTMRGILTDLPVTIQEETFNPFSLVVSAGLLLEGLTIFFLLHGIIAILFRLEQLRNG